jgi:thiamine-phosphate pyrophosphorylase
MMDVNFNRAREALRILEDFARFELGDRKTFTLFRKMRHRIASLGKNFFKEMVDKRNAELDIGIETPLYPIKNKEDLLVTNFKRLQEALRALEEYFRITKENTSIRLKKLRFQAYVLEKEIIGTISRVKKLKTARLYVILTDATIGRGCEKLARKLAEIGVDMIQLRFENISDSKYIKLARRIAHFLKDTPTLLMINNRIDIALTVEADGVHLGRKDISLKDARKLLGIWKIIGSTTHNFREASRAEREGADYISVGPIFPSQTKPELKPCKISFIKDVVKNIKIPTFAIGGINLKNLKTVFKMGLERIAVSSGIILQNDPCAIAKRFKEALSTQS